LEELPALIAAVKPAEPETTTVYGEAQVSFGYTAKVKAVLNKDGTIVSVTDNGTVPGDDNSGFWTNAINNITAKLKGKKVSELDTSNKADVVSSATVSSQAIKTALKNATAEAPTTLEAPTISAADLRTEPVFAADEDAAFTVTGEEGSTTYTTPFMGFSFTLQR
jgi:hypothetical protein